jgi:hypothetical protein
VSQVRETSFALCAEMPVTIDFYTILLTCLAGFDVQKENQKLNFASEQWVSLEFSNFEI